MKDVVKTLQDMASANRVSQNVAVPARRTSFHSQFHQRDSRNGQGRFSEASTWRVKIFFCRLIGTKIASDPWILEATQGYPQGSEM